LVRHDKTRVAVKKIRDCRAMGSLFRQFAVIDPEQSAEHLIEAQKWEHVAEAEITSHLKNATPQGLPSPNGVTGSLIACLL
jgi:hypothetical protein